MHNLVLSAGIQEEGHICNETSSYTSVGPVKSLDHDMETTPNINRRDNHSENGIICPCVWHVPAFCMTN